VSRLQKNITKRQLRDIVREKIVQLTKKQLTEHNGRVILLAYPNDDAALLEAGRKRRSRE
jgi:hypothetical protein